MIKGGHVRNKNEIDHELVQIAKDLISLRFKKDKHHIASALRTTDGKVYRELISDYSPSAKVIINRNGKIVSVPVMDLLPDKYKR